MEGSDTDTRRRTACELVKGLTTYYEQQVSSNQRQQQEKAVVRFDVCVDQ
jgi:hypothetical protein